MKVAGYEIVVLILNMKKITKQIPWNKGKTLSEIHKQRLSESHKKQIPWFIKRGIKNYTNSGTFKKGGRMPSLEDRKKTKESLIKKYANGYIAPMKGRKHSEETKIKIGLTGTGRPAWNKGLNTGIKPWLGKKRPDIAGKNCYNWKGGVTTADSLIRGGIEIKSWRSLVFKRDNYRCLGCGERGCELNADHIYPFSKYIRLRFDINNGQTLCKKCHIQKSKLDRNLIATY